MTEPDAPPGRVLVDTASTLVRILTLAPGEIGPWHWHTHVTDQTLCLEGRLWLDLESPDDTFELVAGTARVVPVPPHQVHRVRNPAAASAAYLLIQHGGPYDFNQVTEAELRGRWKRPGA
ncbi:MAG TPA: cupin domain-containing protein [Polyangiaceae bacterium]